MNERRATVTVHSRAGGQRVDLPPGSAAWLYHLTAEAAAREALHQDGSPREDVSMARLNELRAVGQDAAVCRDLLLVSQQSPTGVQVDVLGGSAETALLCLRWTAAEHDRLGAGLSGELGAAVRARAAHLTAWTSLAAASSGMSGSGLPLTDEDRLACCALYSALVMGAVRMVAQAGPSAIPLASMLAADLSLMAGLDDTRQRAETVPTLIVGR